MENQPICFVVNFYTFSKAIKNKLYLIKFGNKSWKTDFVFFHRDLKGQ